jgi:hypothetical protein
MVSDGGSGPCTSKEGKREKPYKCKEGDTIAVGGSASIRDDMRRGVGWEVYLEYTGNKPTDKGNPMKLFELAFKPTEDGELP